MSNLEKTLKQIEALEDAIASGALKVKYADREVNYRSLDEMIRALSFLEKKAGKKKGISLVESSYSSGLE